MYTLHRQCRACGYGNPGAAGIKSDLHEHLIPVFDLGVQPLANDFVDSTQEHAGCAPLQVLLCPRCGLAQLSITVRPDILYRRYSYITDRSDTMLRHFADLEEALRAESPCESLLEIGSNDGALLRWFKLKGVKVAGIDPAENLATLAREYQVPTITGLFSRKTAGEALAAHGMFDVILARHVFCHIDDWKEFIAALAIPCHKRTVVAIEVPYVKDLLERGEFDTIYHEHLSYLNIGAMQELLAPSPFRLQKILRFSIHGGAILILLRHNEHPSPIDPSVADFLARENLGENDWSAFSKRAKTNIVELENWVRKTRKEGKSVVGFGASAKSTVWVNACHFTRKDLAWISDTTPQKWYKTSPGSDIPIVDEGAILRELPDYAVCFAWNFRDFILRNNEQARNKGVKFVFPVPALEIV